MYWGPIFLFFPYLTAIRERTSKLDSGSNARQAGRWSKYFKRCVGSLDEIKNGCRMLAIPRAICAHGCGYAMNNRI